MYFAAITLLSCNSQQIDKSFGDKQQQSIATHQTNKMQTDTIKRPFQVIFKNAIEIRMGSPYNFCDIDLKGTDRIALPKATWQDKVAWTDDAKLWFL